jgi:hypothetical protein
MCWVLLFFWSLASGVLAIGLSLALLLVSLSFYNSTTGMFWELPQTGRSVGTLFRLSDDIG